MQFGIRLDDIITDDVDPTRLVQMTKQLKMHSFISKVSDPDDDDPWNKPYSGMPLAMQLHTIPLRANVAGLSNLYQVHDPLLIDHVGDGSGTYDNVKSE